MKKYVEIKHNISNECHKVSEDSRTEETCENKNKYSCVQKKSPKFRKSLKVKNYQTFVGKDAKIKKNKKFFNRKEGMSQNEETYQIKKM